MDHSIYLLKQAWLGLSAKKYFCAAIITTLGLSLGALLCILTLAHVMLMKPLPYPDQDKLYLVQGLSADDSGRKSDSFYHNLGSLHYLYENQEQFSQVALLDFREGVVSSLPKQPLLNMTFATPDLFPMLGASVEIGRVFEQSEEKDTYNPVAILSYETWQQEFNGDKSILEQSLSIRGVSYRIVGVLSQNFVEPQFFEVGRHTNVFLPWDYNPMNLDEELREIRGMFSTSFQFVGKLEGSANPSQTEQTLSNLINDEWQVGISDNPYMRNWTLYAELQSFKSAILGDNSKTILLMLVGVFGLVLVSCANVSNLFMSRTAEQQRELAIQAAIGAKKSHLFQTLFAQSGLLVVTSMFVALVIAHLGFWLLQEYLALRIARVEELSLNFATLISAVVITLLLGFFFARLSANMVNYRALNTTLQSSGKGTGIQVSQKVRQVLITSQITIVTLLVFINMGLLRDALQVINLPLGYETNNVVSITARMNGGNELSLEEYQVVVRDVEEKLSTLPQVVDVSMASSPLTVPPIRVQVIEATQEHITAPVRVIDDKYFQTLNQPLVEGVFYSDVDVKDQNDVLIINDVYAAKIAPNGSALGQKVAVGDGLKTIIGVVKGVKLPTDTEVSMEAYPLTSEDRMHFLMKIEPGQTLSQELLVSGIQDVDQRIDLFEYVSLDDQHSKLLFTQITTAITSAVLAMLTFFLATVGLYGILNYATQMRKFELGTRLAIGAKRKEIVQLTIKDNVQPVGLGIVISMLILLATYIIFADAITNYVTPLMLAMFPITLVLVCLMTLFACYWPLRPIINQPPVSSLRESQ